MLSAVLAGLLLLQRTETLPYASAGVTRRTVGRIVRSSTSSISRSSTARAVVTPLQSDVFVDASSSPMDFIGLIKTLASRRSSLADAEKALITRRLFEVLPLLTADQICDCLWSVGTLAFTSSDLSGAQRDLLVLAVDSSWPIEDEKQLIKAFSGLAKIGLKWEHIPLRRRTDFLVRFLSNSTVSAGEDRDRETSSLVYTLGQLGCGKAELADAQVLSLLWRCQASSACYSPQGIANVYHGLAKIGFSCSDLEANDVGTALSSSAASHMEAMAPPEISSVLNSLALMKARWSNLPADLQLNASRALRRAATGFNCREISNAMWYLGKLNADMSAMHPGLRDELVRVLERNVYEMTAFDVESVLVGLGLMQVPMKALAPRLQSGLLDAVARHLSALNIFGVSNVLWGLARMETHLDLQARDSALSGALLDRTVFMLHTFLPTQYGDVLWSLGSLGFRAADMTTVTRDRILAVLSRVFGELHVRAAAYALWGLGKMGFGWKDMQARTRSLAGGREAQPLEESVCAYLRRRVSSMKEHEYAVLLYALGLVQARWDALPAPVRQKLDHRVVRVGPFLSARSASNALYGMSRMEVGWNSLSAEARTAWTQALEQAVPSMNALELSQLLYAAGVMGVSWPELPLSLRTLLMLGIEGKFAAMSDHGLSTATYGLALSHISWESLPTAMKARLVELLLQEDIYSRPHALSCSFVLQALALYEVTLSATQSSLVVDRMGTFFRMDANADVELAVDMVFALTELGLLQGRDAVALKADLLRRIKSSSASVPPKKLASLARALTKLTATGEMK